MKSSRLMLPALAISLIFLGLPAPAQKAPTPQSLGPIQDNSFLIEEAYNQEPGVIQHINYFSRLTPSREWVYTFTEEWPVGGLKNQLSLTLTGLRSGEFASVGAGFGDTAINYRYQLIGSGETRVAFSPRISLLLATGNQALGRGYGGSGLQTNLPLSVVLSRHFVTHWNAGATWIPNARNQANHRARSWGYNFGQSTVWLATPRFNVLVETLWTGSDSVVAPGRTEPAHDLFISPGARWAYNFSSGLQIVPGVAVPLGVGSSSGQKGFILYLSFEHPLRLLSRN